MSGDEAQRELERAYRDGDPTARKALLDLRLREEGPGAFVMDFVKDMLEAGPVTVSIPYRDACGAYVRYVGEAGRNGSWRCPVCGCAYPYVFWDMRSAGSARTWLPGEIVLGLDEDACPRCGELAGPSVQAPAAGEPVLKPVFAAATSKPESACKSEAQECRCQRKRRILGDELRELEAKIGTWTRDVEFLGKRADEHEAAGHPEAAARERAVAEKAKSDLEEFRAKAEGLRQELAVDRED